MENDTVDRRAARAPESKGEVNDFVEPIERLQIIARTMRRHSLHLSKHSTRYREIAWQLDREIAETFNALDTGGDGPAGAVQRGMALRQELHGLRERATALAALSTELTEQAQRVREESVAVNEEILALRTKSLRSFKNL